MCGRFTLRANVEVIAQQFSLFELPELHPRFNVAPTQPVLAIRCVDAQRTAEMLHWGLVPPWASDPRVGTRMINARIETVAEKPAFRAAVRRRRCLVVADGFYEWQASGRAKQPFFIRRSDDQPFGIAGIWECWEGAGHSYLESVCLLTRAANSLVAPIHDRMPVMVDQADYEEWLDPTCEDARKALALCLKAPPGVLVATPVSTIVNRPENDRAECILPLA